MTFWQFFDEHPFVGLLLSAWVIVMVTSATEVLIRSVASVLIARHTRGKRECTESDRDHEEEA